MNRWLHALLHKLPGPESTPLRHLTRQGGSSPAPVTLFYRLTAAWRQRRRKAAMRDQQDQAWIRGLLVTSRQRTRGLR